MGRFDRIARVLLISFGAIVASASSAQVKGETMTALPTTTRPSLTIPGLHNSDIVSVSEARPKRGGKRTRIFRYSFRAPFGALVKSLSLKLGEGKGWKSSKVDPHEVDFWRDLPNGPVAMQGVLVFEARLRPNKWSPIGWAPLPLNRSHGWVWVSYDEKERG